MIPLVLLFLATACTALWVLPFCAALSRNRPLVAVSLGLSAIHEISLVALPIVHSVVVNFRNEREMTSSPDETALLVVMIGELLFLIVLIGGLRWGAGSRCGSKKLDISFSGRQQAVMAGIAVLGLVGVWNAINHRVPTIGESTRHAGVHDYEGLVEVVFNWVMSAAFVPSIAAGAVLLTTPRSAKALRVIGVALLMSFVVLGLVTGVRGRITWSLFPVLTLAIVWKRRTIAVVTILASLCAGVIFGVLGEESFRWRMMTEMQGQSQLQVLEYGMRQFREPGYKTDVGALADSLVYRAMGPRNSTVLYQMYDQGESAGARVLLSALVFPVPRLLWPDKPPAGSLDASPYSGAMYQVMSRGHSAPFYVMGPFLASAHAYWEGGLLGLILEAGAIGLVWGRMLRFAESKSKELGLFYTMMCLGAFMLDGLYTANVPLYALIRFGWLSFLPLVVCFAWAERRVKSRGKLSAASTLPECPGQVAAFALRG